MCSKFDTPRSFSKRPPHDRPFVSHRETASHIVRRRWLSIPKTAKIQISGSWRVLVYIIYLIRRYFCALSTTYDFMRQFGEAPNYLRCRLAGAGSTRVPGRPGYHPSRQRVQRKNFVELSCCDRSGAQRSIAHRRMHDRHPQRPALCAPQARRKLGDQEIGAHALGHVQRE